MGILMKFPFIQDKQKLKVYLDTDQMLTVPVSREIIEKIIQEQLKACRCSNSWLDFDLLRNQGRTIYIVEKMPDDHVGLGIKWMLLSE